MSMPSGPRWKKTWAKVEAEIKSLSGRLSNSGFVDKAPADVVQGPAMPWPRRKPRRTILKSRLAML
jgi:valyl-tRNA synthetase